VASRQLHAGSSFRHFRLKEGRNLRTTVGQANKEVETEREGRRGGVGMNSKLPIVCWWRSCCTFTFFNAPRL